MIEYLNALATVLLLFITLASLLGRERLDLHKIWEGIEPLKNVLEFIGNLPKWLNYYNDLNSNVLSLQDKRDRLERRMVDLRNRVEDQEFQTGRLRKQEVDNWLSSVGTKDTEVKAILEQVVRETGHFSQFLHRAWLGNHVERKIQEVDDLYVSGVFEEVLSPVREARELVARQILVGEDMNKNISMILTWLRDGVTKVGVQGIRGIGKTESMKHIHNRLLRSGNLCIYYIQVTEDSTEYSLQSCIANALNLGLEEEDGSKRAALLYRALGRKNFVLILDGLRRYFQLEDVGIPLHATQGRMIITSRSPDVCRRMGCQNIITIHPLPLNEALELFKQELELTSPLEPPIADIAQQIVEQCSGVARRIIDKAIDLKRVDDISEWERNLSEMLVPVA